MVDEVCEKCHENAFSDGRPNATVPPRTSAREGVLWGVRTLATAAERSAPGLIGAEAADVDLVVFARAGDDRAFAQLYERYHRPVAAYVHGMVKDHARAEDITQDAFISALRRMRQTEQPIAFRPWIYEIAKNATIDQFRRSRRADEVSYDRDDVIDGMEAGRFSAAGAEPAAAIDRKLTLDHLCGAFGGLSDMHHQILVLREFEGLSYQEIGDRLGMTGAAVESTLFRARKRLAEEYGELVSGERCLRVQAAIAARSQTVLNGRDGRRVSRHISHCDPCRRHARLAGVDVDGIRRPLRARVAAVLPLPAVLRRRWGGDDAGASGVLASHAPGVSNVSASLAPVAEPVTTWVKAVAVVAAVAVAGTGAGVATDKIDLPSWKRLPLVGASGDGSAPAGPGPGHTEHPRGGTSGSAGPQTGGGRREAGLSTPASGQADAGTRGGAGEPATSAVPERSTGPGAALLEGDAPQLRVPTGGGGSGSETTVPTPREVGDTTDGTLGEELPAVRDAAEETRLPSSLPQVPETPDPASVVGGEAPALPEVPDAPSLPDPDGATGELTRILRGVTGS
jgi:RNA polymerase sigma factor (sigma-70 family)